MVDLPKGITPFEEEDKKEFSLPKGITPFEEEDKKISVQDSKISKEEKTMLIILSEV